MFEALVLMEFVVVCIDSTGGLRRLSRSLLAGCHASAIPLPHLCEVKMLATASSSRAPMCFVVFLILFIVIGLVRGTCCVSACIGLDAWISFPSYVLLVALDFPVEGVLRQKSPAVRARLFCFGFLPVG